LLTYQSEGSSQRDFTLETNSRMKLGNWLISLSFLRKSIKKSQRKCTLKGSLRSRHYSSINFRVQELGFRLVSSMKIGKDSASKQSVRLNSEDSKDAPFEKQFKDFLEAIFRQETSKRQSEKNPDTPEA
jgi:hypothetical protein